MGIAQWRDQLRSGEVSARELTDRDVLERPQHQALQLAVRDLAEIDQALDRWSLQLAARSLQGTTAGLVAARRMAGLAVSGEGERISLAMTGFADMAFTGRVLKVGLDLVMPADILPADYDRLILNLAGSHSADLVAGAGPDIADPAMTAVFFVGKSPDLSKDLGEAAGRPARGILLVAMMHLDDFEIELIAEDLGGATGQPEEGVHSDRIVRCVDDRDLFGRTTDQFELGVIMARRAHHEWRA
jgi:hypothetical protein